MEGAEGNAPSSFQKRKIQLERLLFQVQIQDSPVPFPNGIKGDRQCGKAAQRGGNCRSLDRQPRKAIGSLNQEIVEYQIHYIGRRIGQQSNSGFSFCPQTGVDGQTDCLGNLTNHQNAEIVDRVL